MTVVGVIFYMVYTPLLLYAIFSVLVASFGTFLAPSKRSGHQPATIGHLQTIADLVDDWTPSENRCIYWRDKEESSTSAVCHAGTTCKLETLCQILPDALYAS